MRSFLECVSCWGTTTVGSMSEEVVTAATPAREEETKSLMPPETAALRKKKNRVRVSLGTTGSMNPQWKPSLCVITEDNVMTEKREKTLSEATTTMVDREVKKKSTAGSRSKAHVRSYSNDMGRNQVPVVLPMFSLTPFMF